MDFDMVGWVAKVENRLATLEANLTSHTHQDTVERLDEHDSRLTDHDDRISRAHTMASEAEVTAEEATAEVEQMAQEAAEAEPQETTEETPTTETVVVQRHESREPEQRPFRVL